VGVLLSFNPSFSSAREGVPLKRPGPDLRSPDQGAGSPSFSPEDSASALGRRHRLGVKSPLAHLRGRFPGTTYAVTAYVSVADHGERVHTCGMKLPRIVAVAAAASVLLVGIAGCATTSPVVTPVVVNSGDIQGSVVEVPLNSTVVINTGDLDVDSYTAEIADPSIAEFVQGKEDASASFNPGLKPKKVGETEVTLANENGGIQNVEFTLKVTPVPAGGNLGGSGR